MRINGEWHTVIGVLPEALRFPFGDVQVWLPRPDELPRLFGGLRILRYEDLRARADWSWRPERIARLVAVFDLPVMPGELLGRKSLS